MKLSVDFASIESVARKFNSERSFDIDVEPEPAWDPIDIRLETGVEIDLSELSVIDGLLSYEGRHVILYIRDHGRSVTQALEDPSKGRKFHLADCVTLEEMRRQHRFERYVVTRKATGFFEISGLDQFTQREIVGEAALQVCMNCLKRLNYRSYLLEGTPRRHSIRNQFQLVEFFETYSTRFRELPAGFAAARGASTYSADWPEVSRRTREQAHHTCQDCRVQLGEHRSLLHVHHINGVKNDNRSENLRVLCKDCHRKQPQHEHIFLTASEMSTLYRLRRTQGVTTRSWECALKQVDLAVKPVLELAKHQGWPAPDVGVPVGHNHDGHLDAAWEVSGRAVSSSLSGGRVGRWSVTQPGAFLSELSEGLR